MIKKREIKDPTQMSSSTYTDRDLFTKTDLRLMVSFSLFLVLGVGGCTRVDWVPSEDAIDPFVKPQFSVEGSVCTSPSRELSYPLRVLFVVDGSESMEVSDPPDPETDERGRQRAVREAWEMLLEESNGDEESRIGIMRFSAQAEFLTVAGFNTLMG